MPIILLSYSLRRASLSVYLTHTCLVSVEVMFLNLNILLLIYNIYCTLLLHSALLVCMSLSAQSS
jgi:hypothetical protein